MFYKKSISFLTLMLFLAVVISCEHAGDVNPASETKNVESSNGRLVFKDHETFLETLNSMYSKTDEEIAEWTKSIGHVSFQKTSSQQASLLESFPAPHLALLNQSAEVQIGDFVYVVRNDTEYKISAKEFDAVKDLEQSAVAISKIEKRPVLTSDPSNGRYIKDEQKLKYYTYNGLQYRFSFSVHNWLMNGISYIAAVNRHEVNSGGWKIVNVGSYRHIKDLVARFKCPQSCFDCVTSNSWKTVNPSSSYTEYYFNNRTTATSFSTEGVGEMRLLMAGASTDVPLFGGDKYRYFDFEWVKGDFKASSTKTGPYQEYNLPTASW